VLDADVVSELIDLVDAGGGNKEAAASSGAFL
jgi:hypothetical protein